ncbi:MAG: hypothetical protein JWO25_1005 [Alphaproteobacteria bacterium]|nr:hypothetical protein [Alphaproteobacteria bacterium]
MRKLEWTGPARSDLKAIDSWLTREANPQIAAPQLIAIRERANFLLDFPEGEPILPELAARTLRVPGTPYRLCYRLLDSGSIQILRVYHVRQDWRGA